MITSLGTVLLDEFCWLGSDGSDARPREVRLGGGGTYAAIGARVWTRDVRLVVDRGPDFPPEIQAQFDSLGAIWHYRDIATPTPRALNTFRPPSTAREFCYVTAPPGRSPEDLASDPTLASPTFVHLCCPPSSLEDLLPALSTLGRSPPQLIYEPIPFACVASSLPALRRVLPHVRVFSPNHEEAEALLALPEATSTIADTAAIEQLAQRFRDEGARDVVIRAGERGAFVLPEERRDGVWVKPYHSSSEGVKDTVGAGNSFLGGLMAGLAREDDLVEATRYASVSAGIVVESVGLPALTMGSDVDEEELWNGRSARARLNDMRR